MPAQRKPEGQRVRRNLGQSQFVELPAEGYQGEIPAWPLDGRPTAAERRRWEAVWRTAQAAQWVRLHIDLVIARYVRLVLAVEAETKNNVASAQTLNTVTAMEDRLGLSPKALQNLSWKIVDDEVGERRAPASSAPAARRRLSAVDPA
jgi:hypothetical protein